MVVAIVAHVYLTHKFLESISEIEELLNKR